MRTLGRFQGRRREDWPESGPLPPDFKVGDYWKNLDADGKPKIVHAPGKLTEECWSIVVPMGDGGGYGIGNLANHTVRENEDGTISVLPGDGSSNSILVGGPGERSWHGYIYSGEFREIG